MTTVNLLPLTVDRMDAADSFDEAELAAAAFLARYNGRTPDAYRHDLRTYLDRVSATPGSAGVPLP